MEPEVWSAVFAGVAVAVAGVSVWIAVRANARADIANEHADAANKIARDANRLSVEANDAAQQALAIEEQRDLASARPKLHVRLGDGHGSLGTFDVKVSHDGPKPLDQVRLKVRQPGIAAFYSEGAVDYANLTVGEPLPQDLERGLGRLDAGEERTLQLMWRNTDQRVTTIISEIRLGDDSWPQRHELDLDDDSRFE